MAEWHAEVAVDEQLVRRLLGQFPALALDSVRLVGEGWDNSVWAVDGVWAFRFPRRAIALSGVRNEIAVLPALASRLPLRIPVPELVGRPADDYPWPFFGARLLQGREACDVTLDDAARETIGCELATFLRRLHATAPPAVLPVDPNARADMPRRVARTRQQLGEVERLGLWRRPRAVDRLLDAAERLPPPDHAVLAHGDLHFRHVLVAEQGHASGVIDWGDVCRADPAIDLQLCWSFLPPAGRAAFLETYGAVTAEQLTRARVLALSLCAALAAYGHVEGNLPVLREAVDGLERIVLD